MKEKFLGFLLAVITLFIGVNATNAADTGTATVKMTYIDNDNSTTSFGEIESGNTATAGYNKISNGYVSWGYSGWGVNYVTYIQVDASNIEGDILSATLTADCSGSTDSGRATTWGVGYNSSTWSSELTAATADLSITTCGSTSTTTTKSASTFESLSFDIIDAFTNDTDNDNVVTILVYETAAAGGYIKNPVVTITYGSAAEYTVKYVDSNGSEIKESATYTGSEGDSIELTEDDTESIWYNDMKYIYSSDDSSDKTVASDGTTVVTVTFRSAETYSYSLVASVEDYEIASGTDYEGEEITIPYSEYINFDGTLYSTTAYDNSYKTFSYTFTLSSDEQIETLKYSETDITNVVYFSEAEDIEGMTECTGNSLIRSSNCLAAYAASDNITITTLPAGTYTIYVATFNGSASTEATFTIYVGETAYSITATVGNKGSDSTNEFTITESASVVLTGGEGSTNAGYDYIYIVGTSASSTAIESINAEQVENDDAYYNLQGIKVLNPTRGIYIHNGKKVLVK